MPLPERPTIATVVPDAARKLTPASTRPLLSSYANEALRNSTSPRARPKVTVPASGSAGSSSVSNRVIPAAMPLCRAALIFVIRLRGASNIPIAVKKPRNTEASIPGIRVPENATAIIALTAMVSVYCVKVSPPARTARSFMNCLRLRSLISANWRC